MKFSLRVAGRDDGKIQPFYVYIVAFALGVLVLLFFFCFLMLHRKEEQKTYPMAASKLECK